MSDKRILVQVSIFLISILILTGCLSTGPKRSKDIITESFITDIKEDGTKLFVYVANFKASKIRTNKSVGQGRNNGQKQPTQSVSNIRSDMAERQEKVALEALELKLQITGFCRLGYFVLGNYNQFGSVEIRAECHESASKTDRKLFGQI